MFPTHEKYPFSVSETHFSLKLYDVSFVILLQHPFQVRSLVEYLSCKLRVRVNLPVSVVLEGTGTDVQSLAHFLAREEKFAIKEWFVLLPQSVSPHLSMPRRPAASRPSPCSSLLLFPSYLSVFRFIRLRKKQCFHILALVIALVSDLRKRQHARITIMLQGALADVQQPAHITIVQPVRMLTFLSECLVAAFCKAQPKFNTHFA